MLSERQPPPRWFMRSLMWVASWWPQNRNLTAKLGRYKVASIGDLGWDSWRLVDTAFELGTTDEEDMPVGRI